MKNTTIFIIPLPNKYWTTKDYVWSWADCEKQADNKIFEWR